MPADPSTDVLLVTGANGKQARALLTHLHPEWKNLRLVVRSNTSKTHLETLYPTAEVIIADLTSPETCRSLLENVSAVWLVTPAFTLSEITIANNIIAAASAQRSAGGPFKHLVRSSVLHAQIRKMINHDSKRFIEERIIESGLPYTILQPSHLMETLDVAGIVKNEDLVKMPRLWDPKTEFSFTSARDLGEIGARVLREREKHFGATYEIVSSEVPLSYDEVGWILREELGRDFGWERKSLEEGVEVFAKMMLGDEGEQERVDEAERFECRQGVARMFMYYNQKGLIGNSNVAEMLLGRKPTSYREWVRAVIREVKG